MGAGAVVSAGGPTRATAAALFAFSGSMGLLVADGLWANAVPAALGVAGLAIAADLWRGSGIARWAALVAGPIAILGGKRQTLRGRNASDGT